MMETSENIPKRVRYTRAVKHNPEWSKGLSCGGNWHIQESDISPLSENASFLLRQILIKPPDCGEEELRVVFLSDLHWDNAMGEEYEQLADGIKALKADVILFGGDLCVFMDGVAGALSWLRGICAKRNFAVAGNRESIIRWHNKDYWRKLYASANFEYLCNELTELEDVLVFGLDDARYGNPDWSPLAGKRTSGKLLLSISHNPDGVADVPGSVSVGDLVLCGHTHGGQLKLPLLGPLYTSSAYGRQFYHGWNSRADGAACLTSSGIGESGFGILHRRLLCPRELVLLRIFRAKN